MLVTLIFQEVDRLLRTLVPRKSVYFAFDGPAPLAKLMTQRSRRAKRRARDGGGGAAAAAAADMPAPVEEGPPPTAEELAAAALAEARKRRKARYRVARGDGVDPLAMAPGTELMAYLASSLEYWCVSRLQSDRRYEHVTAIVSGPHVAGEGELKIIDYLHTSVAPTDSVVIVGSDADIILQGVLTTCVRDFFVYIGGAPREPATLLSVWMLVRQLDELFPGESAAVRADFVVLCLLNGNDYLPKLRGSSFPRLWNRYKRLKSASGGHGSAMEEESATVTAASAGGLGVGRFYDVESYLRGILWTLAMYVDGVCPDFTYMYTKKYSPSPAVLVAWIRAHDGDPPGAMTPPISLTPPLPPHKATLALLPPRGAHLLPGPLRPLIATPAAAAQFISDVDGTFLVDRLHAAVDAIPLSAYTLSERRRTMLGAPQRFRRPPGAVSRLMPVEAIPPPPGRRFGRLTPRPAVDRVTLALTAKPPCRPWPAAVRFRALLPSLAAGVRGGVRPAVALRREREGEAWAVVGMAALAGGSLHGLSRR
ncbi:hypothetical protein I4F81_007587 [Pyropia yezoensis]|uniref:Uncharacterized protein n=1 Tax=Pyropia yezoensis TaxID=2788 RepID=A0ACC3C4F7_PYRYE|nr:hypothetical protein I4F81_007587 [Neopyropia yezoensis]